jgi:putative transferase (TIGR04331 family)
LWCIDLNNKKLNFKYILDHPYRNLKFREKSRRYIKKLYKKISPKLYQDINLLHKTNHQYNYWDNILGYYLESILSQLYEKWICVEKTKKLNKKFTTEFYNFDYKDLVFNSADEYEKQFFVFKNTEYWHHFCYALIIKYHQNIKYKILKKPNIKKFKKIQNKTNLKIKFLYLISDLILKLNKNIENIFISTINPKLTIKTSLKLKKLFLYKREPKIKYFEYDSKLRNWSINFNHQNKFEEFLSKELPKIIPKSVIEAYKYYINEINIHHKFNTKNIYLTTSSINDVSKILISEQLKKKTKIINFQHGGNYGFIKNFTSEEHEIKNSDIFLTFGWGKKNILPTLNNAKCKIKKLAPIDFPKIANEGKKNLNNRLLFILPHFKLYSFANINESYPINHEKLILIDQIAKIFNSLDSKIFKEIEVRFHPFDKITVKKYLMNKIKNNIKILDANNKIFPVSFNKYSLCVSLYPGTSFLQTLYMNIPTLVFFDTKIWKIRNQSKNILNTLKKNKIYFNDSRQISKFINNNSKDFNKWWKYQKTKNAVSNFNTLFANNKNIEKKYINFLKNTIL